MVASTGSNHVLADQTERRSARDSRLDVFSQKTPTWRSEINNKVAGRPPCPLGARGVVGVYVHFESRADQFIVALDLNFALAILQEREARIQEIFSRYSSRL